MLARENLCLKQLEAMFGERGRRRGEEQGQGTGAATAHVLATMLHLLAFVWIWLALLNSVRIIPFINKRRGGVGSGSRADNEFTMTSVSTVQCQFSRWWALIYGSPKCTPFKISSKSCSEGGERRVEGEEEAEDSGRQRQWG